jgi:hypothetical protein
MMIVRRWWIAVAAGLVVACGGDSTGPTQAPAALSCAGTTPTQLAPGAHVVFDPATSGGCLVLPAAGAAAAEYLVVALSTTGQVTQAGVSTPYTLAAQPGAGLMAAVAALPTVASMALTGTTPAARFHDMLRARGRALAHGAVVAPQRSVARLPVAAAAIPPVGSQRNFQVCGDQNCASFVTVTATLKHAGTHGLVYLDTAAPGGGFTQTDLDGLGLLFDRFVYPIDTLSFGHETDLDGNGAVAILLSPAVNRLSGNCNMTRSVILGFFFPGDLLPGSTGSNDGEVFYGLVPDPTSTQCTISRSFVLGSIGPTFLHELQHMISFGHHVVLAGGAAEDNWLDEGLSRLAEELGGREIPDSVCAPATCLSQYPSGDLSNAFQYLNKSVLELSPLIEPGDVDGTLAENGANWLFVRWLADHFAADSILGRSLTRALDGADSPAGIALTGDQNASVTTGVAFPTLVSEWQLANYLTSVSGFTEPTGRLRFKSWNLPAAFAPQGTYPLQPDSVTTAGYTHTGTLEAGSGRHLKVIQAPNGPAVWIALTGTAGVAVSPTVIPRFAVARMR